eukprot:347842-Chlamydomonas_euryale.AAC.2
MWGGDLSGGSTRTEQTRERVSCDSILYSLKHGTLDSWSRQCDLLRTFIEYMTMKTKPSPSSAMRFCVNTANRNTKRAIFLPWATYTEFVGCGRAAEPALCMVQCVTAQHAREPFITTVECSSRTKRDGRAGASFGGSGPRGTRPDLIGRKGFGTFCVAASAAPHCYSHRMVTYIRLRSMWLTR